MQKLAIQASFFTSSDVYRLSFNSKASFDFFSALTHPRRLTLMIKNREVETSPNSRNSSSSINSSWVKLFLNHSASLRSSYPPKATFNTLVYRVCFEGISFLLQYFLMSLTNDLIRQSSVPTLNHTSTFHSSPRTNEWRYSP